jgi:hypothetical protein
MEPEISQLRSELPAIWPYPEPDESILHHHTLLFC